MITVVLVETEGEENIGAISRAMMNMEVSDLALVNPRCDHLSRRAENYSVHAAGILKNARVFTSLDDALSKADISAAITRRVGQWRKRDFVLGDFSEYLLDYPGMDISLVFGREKYGLTNEEIRSCDLICSIPSSAAFPSINLAQAVMVTLYDIYRAGLSRREKKADKPAARENFDSMMDGIILSLETMDFFKTVPSWRLGNYLNKILHRAKLDDKDCLVIRNLFERIGGKFSRFKRRESSPRD